MGRRKMDLKNLKDRTLIFIYNYIGENRYSPTIREIATHIGRNSTSTVDKILTSLQRDGMITRAFSSGRTIVLTDNAFKSLGRASIYGDFVAVGKLESDE